MREKSSGNSNAGLRLASAWPADNWLACETFHLKPFFGLIYLDLA
jgi:hypothetical protein